jgi:adenylate cyclase
MNDAQYTELAAWIAQAGLAGRSETTTLTGFCERAVTFGLPLARANVVIDTLHPIYQGRAFTWTRDQHEATLSEYGRSDEGEAEERWRRSPFYVLEESGEALLQCRVNVETEAEFPIFSELRDAGVVEYVAMANRFASEGIIGDMDCVYSSWATGEPQGFKPADVTALNRLMPLFALAMKSASLARVARTLVETYLGRDAGRRVLEGRIQRGGADRIEAVLWFSDLRSYTRISDAADPQQVIRLLNDYAEAIISAIHGHGGDVLKLMGDGTLAIFTAADRGRACQAALAAASNARRAVATLNRRRAAESVPTTDMYLALHVGEVFYGNVGSRERLDFTVIGPAVNEVSRIAGLCRSVDQPLLISSAFASALAEPKKFLVSVGRYALRGVARPQDLFTIENDADTSVDPS